MRSSCPHCLSMNEHSHDETQVACTSCGQSFSPFLTDSDASQRLDFSESSMAFQEIVSFGENLSTASEIGDNRSAGLTPSPSSAQSASLPPVGAQVPSMTGEHLNSDIILTTTSALPQYPPHQYLPPVSLMILMGEDQAPLENGFKALSEIARKIDAQGIIGIRCSLSPDNRRALLIGTPIRWEKK